MQSGDNIPVSTGAWSFDGAAATNFDDHVSKSVPMYEHAHKLVVGLTDFFGRSGSKIIDIGCSTGSLLEQIAKDNNGKKDLSLVGIDPVADMIELSNSRFQANTYKGIDFQSINGSYMDIEFGPETSSMITSVYTIQFVHPSVRQSFVSKIYNELEWGGAFIFFEKIRASDARFQDLFTTLYNEYKVANGYTPSEILAKSLSLKGVLEPFSSLGNRGLLERAGFKDVEPIFQYLCFQGLLAVK